MTASKQFTASTPTGVPEEYARMLEAWMGNLNRVMNPALWAQPSSDGNAHAAAPTDVGANGAVAGMLGVTGFPFDVSAASPFAAFASQTLPNMFAGAYPGINPGLMPGVMAGNGELPEFKIAPEKLQQLQADYAGECAALMQKALAPAKDFDFATLGLTDKRFSSEAWRETPTSSLAAAWYLLNTRYLTALAEALDADVKTRERVRFAVDQWAAAAAPSNFLALNPDAQKTLMETQGESLRLGILNLLSDLTRGRITQTDEAVFAVGENLANTEGTVVYQNELIQLIQYKPLTATVFEQPLLIVPPCINKYYILDLNPENSLMRFALESGHQVFIISWRNPDASLAGKGWDDYVDEGVLQAIEVVKTISGRKQLNTLGFCVGGTLLATALAVLAARGERPAASMTLLTSMLDFSDTGILDVFIDEAQIQSREQAIGGKHGNPPGLMRGSEFNSTFAFLRPNDLVWNYVVENYLKGQKPPAFDLLFWNSDSTNLPGPMVYWYLRHTYLENALCKPGALTVCGEPVDLGRVDVPTFIYGSREDHIVPWKTAYQSTRLLSGPLRFVLGASGHIAGVINPPSKNKRSYWSATELPETAEAWLAAATEHRGSWWPAWAGWLGEHGGKRVKARAKPGHAKYPALEPAPGSYVMQRA